MNFGAVSTELLLTFLLVAVALLDLILPPKVSRRYMGYFVALFTTGIMCYLLNSYFSLQSISFLPNKFFILDAYAVFFKILFLLALIFTVLFSLDYVEKCISKQGEFYTLLIASIIGMCVLASVTDFVTLFVGLELMTISFYVLTGIRLDLKLAGEGSVKYFLMGASSTAVMLYGISFLYGTCGTLNFLEMVHNITNNFQFISLIGVMLLLIGFFFKLSVIPFHMWAPDVYEASSAPITFFLMTGSKIAALAVFIRVLCLPFVGYFALSIIGFFSLICMILGNIMAIKQENVKRMLAYSSIAQAGYMLVGVYAFSIDGIKAVLFYAMLYLFANIGAFAVLTFVEKEKNDTSLLAFKGLATKSPLMAVVMTISLLSMAGIPPMAGFAGKLYLFSAALDVGGIILVSVGFIMSMISVYYYLLVTKAMYSDVPKAKNGVMEKIYLPKMLQFVLLISVLLTLVCGIYPEGLAIFAKMAVSGFLR